MKDETLKLRLSGAERDGWQRSANLAGLTLSAYVRRCVEETRQVDLARELEVEDARRRQEALKRAAEREYPRGAP